MLPFIVEGGASPPYCLTDLLNSLTLIKQPQSKLSISLKQLKQQRQQRLFKFSINRYYNCDYKIKKNIIKPINLINVIMCGIFLMVTVILVPGISAAAAAAVPEKIPIGEFNVFLLNI